MDVCVENILLDEQDKVFVIKPDSYHFPITEEERRALITSLSVFFKGMPPEQQEKLLASLIVALRFLAWRSCLRIKTAFSNVLSLSVDVKREDARKAVKQLELAAPKHVSLFLFDISAEDMLKIVAAYQEIPEPTFEAALGLSTIDKARPNIPAGKFSAYIEMVGRLVQRIIREWLDVPALLAKELAIETQHYIFWFSPSYLSLPPQEKAEKLSAAGLLDNNCMKAALCWRDYEFVLWALAIGSGVRYEIIEEIIHNKQAEAIVALSWKAGLSPKTAVRLQSEVARQMPLQIIGPKNDGSFGLVQGECRAVITEVVRKFDNK
ncbi:MAG: DUF2336 domain-containing protein [Alphaproteobacteria bacterium]